jgi:hypothetical protein
VSKQQYASQAIEDFQESSGLFDNVNAVITNVQFTTVAPDNYAAEGNPIFANVSFMIDGEGDEAERAVSQGYSLGATAGVHYDVSEDGYGLIAKSTDASLRKGSKWSTFVAALANEGFPKPILQAGDVSKIVGLHGSWKRIADKERSFQNDRKQSAKKFPPSTLVCIKILGMPGAVGTVPTTTTATATATTAPAADFDLDTATFGYLAEVLAKKQGKVQRNQLTLLITQVAMKDVNRLAIAARAVDETFLATMSAMGMIRYDPAVKPQVILAA